MAVGRGRRVLQQRRERFAGEAGTRREAAHVDQRRIEIDQAHGGSAGRAEGRFTRRGVFRGGHDEGHAGGALPAGPLAPVFFFAEVPAVVAPEDDHGVGGGGAGVERVEQFADLRVDERDAREVSRHGGFPLTVFYHGGVGAGGDGIARPFATGGAEVIEIVGLYDGELDVQAGVEIEVFFRREERDMRTIKSDGEKPGLRGGGRLIADLLHGPVGDLAVA